MKVVYVSGGTDIIEVNGITFEKGKPVDVDDDFGKVLLKKTTVKFEEVKEKAKEGGK